jgi:hypothetical protein
MGKAPIVDSAPMEPDAPLHDTFEKERQKVVGPVHVIEVLDDEDEEDGEECQIKGSADLTGAFTKQFTHNSADPQGSGANTGKASGEWEYMPVKERYFHRDAE